MKEKARYVVHHRFGGNSYWDISSDYVGSGSLISTAVDQYSGLDQTSNHLYYPGSRFDNMRSCMGACSPPNYTTTSATTTTTPTSPLSARIPRKNFHARGRGALYPKGRRGHVWYVSNVTIPRHSDTSNNQIAWRAAKRIIESPTAITKQVCSRYINDRVILSVIFGG